MKLELARLDYARERAELEHELQRLEGPLQSGVQRLSLVTYQRWQGASVPSGREREYR